MKTKEQIHDEQISPLIDQIVAICEEHKIAMISSFHLGTDGAAGELLCTTAMTGGDFPVVPPFLAASTIIETGDPMVAFLKTAKIMGGIKKETLQ